MTQVQSWAPRLGRGRLIALLAILVMAMLAIGSSSASALVVHLKNGRAISVVPLPGKRAPKTGALGNGPLEYHGGPIMASNSNYVIFWAPKKHPYAKGFVSGVKSYFKNLAHDSGLNTNSDSVLVQYGANYVSKYAGAIMDKDPYPANGCYEAPICLSDEQLQAEIVKVVESHGLPRDTGHEYFLLTAPNVESCFYPEYGYYCSASSFLPYYCAYHGVIETEKGPIIYSNDPYVYQKNCDETEHHPNGSSDSALLGGMSHEHSESATDPYPGSGWVNSVGEEIGDICRTFEPASEFGAILGTAPDGSPYNYVINGHLYFYQTEWSNSASACVQHA